MKKKVYPTDKVWIARDGKRFYDERECAIYDKFHHMPLKDFLSPYMEFSNWGTKKMPPWKIINNCCVIFADIPEEILEYLQLLDTCERSHFPWCCENLYIFSESKPALLRSEIAKNSNNHVRWYCFGDIKQRKSHILKLKKRIDSIKKLLERRA